MTSKPSQLFREINDPSDNPAEMNLASIESNAVEERGNNETDAYPVRNRAELEDLVEDNMQDPGSREDSIQEVRDILNDTNNGVRGSVGNHNQAPIRSLVNPEENLGTIKSKRFQSLERSWTEQIFPMDNVPGEEKKDVQVVGEEFFVNANLENLPHIGTVQWWTVYDSGRYSEEDPGGRGEHLSENNREGEMHKYRLEVDGEVLGPEESWRFARHLKRARDNQITENDIAEIGRVPELVLEYDDPEEITESEDKTRDEFESEYKEAQNLGLVTEEGNITLKGWLSAVDMESLDVRQLEEVVDGREEVVFSRGNQAAFERLLGSENSITEGDVRLHISYSGQTLHEEEFEGRINNSTDQVVGGLSQLQKTLEEIGIDYNKDLSENVRGNLSVGEYFRIFEDTEGDINQLKQRLEEEFSNAKEEDVDKAEEMAYRDFIEITDIGFENPEIELDIHNSIISDQERTEEELRKAAEEKLNLSEIEQYLQNEAENIQISIDPEKRGMGTGLVTDVVYNGDDEFLAAHIDDQYIHETRMQNLVDENGVKELGIDPLPLMLRELETEIEEEGGELEYEINSDQKNELRIHNYDDVGEEVRERIDLMHDLGNVSMSEHWYESPTISLNIDSVEEGRDILEENESIVYELARKSEVYEMHREIESLDSREIMSTLIDESEEIELNASRWSKDVQLLNQLKEYDQEGLVEIEEPSSYLKYGHCSDTEFRYIAESSIDYEIEMDSDNVDVFVLQEERSTTYQVNDELRRIAENLNPLNFQKKSYEDVEIQTGFEYHEAPQEATV